MDICEDKELFENWTSWDENIWNGERIDGWMDLRINSGMQNKVNV